MSEIFNYRPKFIKLIFKDGFYKFDADIIIKNSPKISDDIKSYKSTIILDYDLTRFCILTFDILWSCKYYSVKKFNISPSQLIEVFSLIDYLKFHSDDVFEKLSFFTLKSLDNVTEFYDILENGEYKNSFKRLFRGFFAELNLVLNEDKDYLHFKIKDGKDDDYNEFILESRNSLYLYKNECEIIEKLDRESAKFLALFAKFYNIHKIIIENYEITSAFINNISYIDFTSLNCNLEGEFELPDNIEKLEFLTDLSLYLNNRKKDLTHKIEKLINLKSLKITSEMNYISISALPKFDKLESLFLSYIELDKVQVSSISTYKTLKNLHLEFFANNNIADAINNLPNLTNLTLIPTYDCEWNLKSDFYYIPDYSFTFIMPDKLFNIESLYIQELQDLEYRFAEKLIKYNKLLDLTIIGTEISDDDKSNIFKIPNLEKLRLLEHRHDTNCDWESFEILQNLREWEILGYNFDSKIIRHLKNIVKLKVTFTEYSKSDKEFVSDIFKHLSDLENLRSLSLKFSGIFNLKCTTILKFVEEIQIEGAELSKQDVEFIYNFPLLKRIVLINCNVKQNEIVNSRNLDLTIYNSKK